MHLTTFESSKMKRFSHSRRTPVVAPDSFGTWPTRTLQVVWGGGGGGGDGDLLKNSFILIVLAAPMRVVNDFDVPLLQIGSQVVANFSTIARQILTRAARCKSIKSTLAAIRAPDSTRLPAAPLRNSIDSSKVK